MKILYQDEFFVAIDKPSGLLVHKTKIARREENRLGNCMQMLRDQLGQWVYPVHRLDAGSSGVLLFALSSDVAREAATLFEHRNVEKKYVALVRGFLPSEGVIDRALERLDDEANSEPQAAHTEYRCLRTIELPFAVGPYASARYSLADVSIYTGRRHQIRRHLAGISHPIIGDRINGDGRHNKFFTQQFGVKRLLLHSAYLKFEHPLTRKEVSIAADVPAEFTLIFN